METQDKKTKTKQYNFSIKSCRPNKSLIKMRLDVPHNRVKKPIHKKTRCNQFSDFLSFDPV
jgi:hypothetical protein